MFGIKKAFYKVLYSLLSPDYFQSMSPTQQLKFLSKLQTCLPENLGIFAAQEGEDALIKRILRQDFYKKGFYVDIGAHDPLRFSTTLNFYLCGWRGINIEPLPGSLNKFNQLRTNDINIQSGVSEDSGAMTYYMFNEPAFNTFDKAQSQEALKKSSLLDTIEVKTERLDYLLDKFLPENTVIDFVNIDVEGMEMSVLKSCDWDKYHPTIIAIEALVEERKLKINNYLSDKGYKKVANTKNTLVFVCEKYEC